MNIKHKLEGFSKIAIKEAKAKGMETLDRMEKEYERVCSETALRARKKAGEVMLEESYKAEQMKNKEIQEATLQAKKALIDLRRQLEDELFKGVISMLADYIELDGYSEFLINDIEGIARKYEGGITVYISGRDMIFYDRLMEIPGIKVLRAEEDLIGGYRAVIEDQNIVLDNSYKEKIRKARESFTGFKII